MKNGKGNMERRMNALAESGRPRCIYTGDPSRRRKNGSVQDDTSPPTATFSVAPPPADGCVQDDGSGAT